MISLVFPFTLVNPLLMFPRYIQVYDVSRRPRGHCVIINNYCFREASETHPELRLGNREGTNVDVGEYSGKLGIKYGLP